MLKTIQFLPTEHVTSLTDGHPEITGSNSRKSKKHRKGDGQSHNQRGPQIAQLCTATIRAVAQGVVGIAFIQMLLVGVALVIMGVPAAGVLALMVLLLGITQLPVLLITLPIVIYVFAVDGVSAGTIIFAVWMAIAGLADNVLKPMLLGRGVAVPMPVVLIGALGGMVTSGIIGLFTGPVILAVGYELFIGWVYQPADVTGLLESPRKENLP